MSEPKPDPLRRLNNPESSVKPTIGPDQAALEIIERAAREMATRRPRKPAPAITSSTATAEKEFIAEPVRLEPIKPPVQETVQEPIQETIQVTARDLAKEFDEEIAKQAIAPLEVAARKEEPVEEFASQPEIKSSEEIQSANALYPIEEPAEETAPFDTGGFFATTEEPKPIGLHEPLAKIEPTVEAEPIEWRDSAAATPPAAAVAPAQPKAAPPIAPPIKPVAQPKFAPAAKPPAARPMYDDHFHLALTTVQSVALAVAIFAFVLAAFGMAARGWVVAHDWSCRVGMATNACPPPPPPKSLGRAEIPS